MASVNKIILIGNLGRDPEVKYAQTSGKAVCRFSLATTDRIGGEDRTEWHNIVLFDRQAEVAGEYLQKGRQIYIEGRIQTRKYQDKEGQDRYMTEVIGQSFKMLGSRPASGEDQAPRPAANPAPRPAPRPAPARPAALDDDPFSGDFGPPPSEDDMPF